jgi:hypothetical protein
MSKKITPTVEEFMDALDHPLTELCNTIRVFIKKTNPKIQERIKWNALSYYAGEDFLTFNFSRKDALLLIFHHPYTDQLPAHHFDSKPKGRAILEVKSAEDFNNKASRIQETIHEILSHMTEV